MGKYQNKLAEDKYREFCNIFGITFDNEDSKDTPKRVVAMYQELTQGLRDPEFKFTLFSNAEGKFDQMIVIKDISYQSLCSHHHAPFWGKVNIGYIPKKVYAGLSKFARVVEYFSAKPSVQEALTQEICDYLWEQLDPEGVIVMTSGSHTCMSMRGIKKENVIALCSAIRGNIDKNEFFDAIKYRR